jgi:hypothetical protein
MEKDFKKGSVTRFSYQNFISKILAQLPRDTNRKNFESPDYVRGVIHIRRPGDVFAILESTRMLCVRKFFFSNLIHISRQLTLPTVCSVNDKLWDDDAQVMNMPGSRLQIQIHLYVGLERLRFIKFKDANSTLAIYVYVDSTFERLSTLMSLFYLLLFFQD